VDLTARDAADRGYTSFVVEDAVAEDQQVYHDASLEQFARLFGSVTTTAEIEERVSLQMAKTDERNATTA
jgi:nicotinamidase-related amidase